MSEEVTGLYQKHRPRSFAEVVGQKGVVRQLAALLNGSTFPRSVLFSGPSGCGKTTLARLMRDKLLCHDLDYRELNTADFRGIDDVRRLRDQVTTLPLEESRVWVFDECAALTSDAQKAMLKLVEDAPAFVYLFFCTTDPAKMIGPLRNRCTEYQLQEVPADLIAGLVEKVAGEEGLPVEPEVAARIAEMSGGSPRRALVHLERVIGLSPRERLKALEAAAETVPGRSLAQVLLRRSSWPEVATALRNVEDYYSAQLGVLGYARSVLVGERTQDRHTLHRAALCVRCFGRDMSVSKGAGLALAAYEVLEESAQSGF